MNHLKRTLSLLLAVILLLGIAAPALAATTTISDEDIPYDYFEYYNDGWHDLNTPVHRDASGNYAYCIEHMKDPPSSSTQYTDFNAAAIFSSTTITGIQAIIDHGYPITTGGLGASKAHYATANAIRFWIKESAGVGYNFMADPSDSSKVRAKSDATDCWAFCMQLLQYARAGATTGGGSGGEIVVSDVNLTWQLVGGQLSAELTVTAPDGYTIQPSHSQVQISGYTGGSYDELTITAPTSLSGAQVSLFIQSKASATANSALLYWYEPSSTSKQKVVVAELTAGGTPDSGYVYITGSFCDLTVRKTDNYTDAALDGAVFQLSQGGTVIGLTQTGAGQYTAGGSASTFTTSGGTAKITGLPGGTYTLTETSTPSRGYVGAGSTNINLTGNGVVDIENAPTQVNVVKTDGYIKQPMPGVTFLLRDSAGNPVLLKKAVDGTYRPDANGADGFTVDNQGKAKILYLPAGKYNILEPNAEGYAELGGNSFTLSEITNIKAVNEPLAIALTKVDSFTGKTLLNIPFTLLNGAGQEVTFSKHWDGVYHYDKAGTAGFVTGADGTAAIFYIPAGEYVLRETASLGLGYAQPKDISVEVTQQNGISNPITVRFQNDPTTLEFSKADAVTKEPLDGGTFRLLDESGAVVKLKDIEPGSYRPDAEGAETFVTKGGEAVFRYLTPQKYTIEEVTAPSGYTNDTPKSVTVTAQNDVSNAAKINMQDYALTLVFDKSDGLTDKPLDGCTFILKDSDGKAVKLTKVKNGVYKPDADGSETFTTYEGMATITQIEPGEYAIGEKSVKDGYTKAADVTVTVSETNISTAPAKANMKNGITAISISKADAENGAAIGGAVFKLVNDDGETVKLSAITGKPGWLKPDSKGSETFTVPAIGATIAYLPIGEYELVEVMPGPGYALPEDGTQILVTDETTTAAPKPVPLTNQPLAAEVTKTDGLTGEPLADVNFKVLDADGAALLFEKLSDGEYRVSKTGTAVFQTGPNGKARLFAIPAGSYTLSETDNPGFGKVEPVAFTVSNENTGDTPTVVGMENQPLALEVFKVDKESQKPLEKVPFKLLNTEGEALHFTLGDDGRYRISREGADTFLTDAEGKATILYVPQGVLSLVEQPYAGYGVAAPVSVTISDENIVTLPKIVTVENEPLAVEIYKQDAYTKQPMAASFTLLDSTGKAVKLARMSDGTYRPADKAPATATATASADAALTVAETVDKLTLDAKTGKARIEYLPQGKYQLKEDAVSGYITLTGIEFELKDEHTKTQPLQFTVSNIPTRFLLEKQDGLTKQPLKGAKFKLTDEKGNVIKLVKQEDGTYQPAKQGETGVEVLELSGDKAQAVICYLPAGKVTVTEVEGPSGYSIAAPITTEVGTEVVLHTALAAQAEDMKKHTIAETSLAVIDLPLALKISKVHSKTQKPLAGAGFAIKAEGTLSTPLRFTVRDGVYWYDPQGNVTTIQAAGEQCSALIYGLPAGKYQIEETVVPTNFFPAPPVAVEITVNTTSETPKEVVVTNTPQVKLGIDADKFNVVIAIGLTVLIGAGVGVAALVRWRKKRGSR